MSSPPQRLGKNIDRYFGETIELGAVLDDCLRAGRAGGWTEEQIPVPAKPPLLALARKPRTEVANPVRIYIAAGIHGDEPAGPLAVRDLLQANQWPADAELFVLPCLNPTGFALNTRENSEGIDLNRDYLEPKAAETIAHMEWLARQPRFDLCLCLHEDWEAQGFYVYELNPENQPSLAESIISRAAEVCPIDRSEMIEERPAKEGIIRPSIDPRSRPLWPESFYLLTNKTNLSYTLEAPSDFSLPVRSAALVAGVLGATGAFKRQDAQSA